MLCENTDEDKDLKRALLASIKDIKKNDSKPTAGLKNGKSDQTNKNQCLSKLKDNNISESDVYKNRDQSVGESDCSFLSLAAQRRGKVSAIAQRKFAQTSGHVSNSPVSTPIKTSLVSSPNVVDLFPSQKPKTEEFLTFLCLRRSPILPPNLDFFRIEESEIKLKARTAPKILPDITPTKEPPIESKESLNRSNKKESTKTKSNVSPASNMRMTRSSRSLSVPKQSLKEPKGDHQIQEKKVTIDSKMKTSKAGTNIKEGSQTSQIRQSSQTTKKENTKTIASASSASNRRMTRSSRSLSTSKPVVVDSELERQIKEKIIAIERKHKRLRRCPSNQSLVSSSSSSSSSSESLPDSISSSSSIDNTRLTRSLGHLKKIRDYQAKLKKEQNKKKIASVPKEHVAKTRSVYVQCDLSD